MRFQLAAGYPNFLDLPWEQPLETWQSDRLVQVARGISRHVVRFVAHEEAVYALKELPPPLVGREYELLRRLADLGLPVVAAVGTVRDRGREPASGDELDPVLITRHLDFALPYRALFGTEGMPGLRDRLLDSLADLLVRLHLAGFFWGDCSLSNTLFRRDAGALAAYLVDAETGELHAELSDGLRAYDLDIAVENIGGELLDLAAAGSLSRDIEPLATAEEVRSRYGGLWAELTREEVFGPQERYLIDARLRRINELGFDVEEVELVTVAAGDGHRLRLRTQVVERGHHRRRFHDLTGIVVQENQARRLLNDIACFAAYLARDDDHPLPESVVAYRWLSDLFDRAVAMVPAELRAKREPAELYHELLVHRWFLSEAAGRDVGLEDAVRSYVTNVLPFTADERRILPSDTLP